LIFAKGKSPYRREFASKGPKRISNSLGAYGIGIFRKLLILHPGGLKVRLLG
jgi:hypothetical protein